MEEAKKLEEEHAAKADTKESLINDLMSDEEEDETNGAKEQEDVEMTEFTAWSYWFIKSASKSWLQQFKTFFF